MECYGPRVLRSRCSSSINHPNPRLLHLRGRREKGLAFFPVWKQLLTFSCETFCSLSFFKDPKKVGWKIDNATEVEFFSEFFLPFTNKSLKIWRVSNRSFRWRGLQKLLNNPRCRFVCLGYVYIYMGWNTNLLCGDYNKSLWGSLGIWCNGSLWKDHLCKMGSVMVVLFVTFFGMAQTWPFGFLGFWWPPTVGEWNDHGLNCKV